MLSRRYLMPLKELFTSCTCGRGQAAVSVWEGHRQARAQGKGQGRTHLGAPVHEEHGGVLLPRLQGVRLVDHAVEPHVRPRVEVEDLRRHVVRGAACGKAL